jgi:hypothetical protein
MKIFWRGLFLALVAGAFCLAIAIPIQYSNSVLSGNLVIIAGSSLFGLQLWSIIFLKTEPNLTRIGLVVVAVGVLVLLGMAFLAGISQLAN